jgi:hypothetical protein
VFHGTGFRKQGTGYRIQDSGYRIQDIGYWFITPPAEGFTDDSYWRLEAGCLKLQIQERDSSLTNIL